MPRRSSVGSITFLLGLLVGGGGGYYFSAPPVSTHTPFVSVNPAFTGQTPYKVVRVVDGDTVVLLIGGKEQKVRLIGVDTPETVKPNTPVQPYGPEASRFTKNLLTGESVFIEVDPDGAGTRDRFKRELAFIYRAPDGLFVNLELVRQGYGRVYRKVNFKYRDQFEQAEVTAEREHKGIWGL